MCNPHPADERETHEVAQVPGPFSFECFQQGAVPGWYVEFQNEQGDGDREDTIVGRLDTADGHQTVIGPSRWRDTRSGRSTTHQPPDRPAHRDVLRAGHDLIHSPDRDSPGARAPHQRRVMTPDRTAALIARRPLFRRRMSLGGGMSHLSRRSTICSGTTRLRPTGEKGHHACSLAPIAGIRGRLRNVPVLSSGGGCGRAGPQAQAATRREPNGHATARTLPREHEHNSEK